MWLTDEELAAGAAGQEGFGVGSWRSELANARADLAEDSGAANHLLGGG
jgi:hypothetical protein